MFINSDSTVVRATMYYGKEGEIQKCTECKSLPPERKKVKTEVKPERLIPDTMSALGVQLAYDTLKHDQRLIEEKDVIYLEETIIIYKVKCDRFELRRGKMIKEEEMHDPKLVITKVAMGCAAWDK